MTFKIKTTHRYLRKKEIKKTTVLTLVSRMHAQIDEAQGRLYLYDLNSTNGTFVNGQRIKSEEYEIKEGDEIQIGNVRFVLA